MVVKTKGEKVRERLSAVLVSSHIPIDVTPARP
jgi:hypothetical protein